MPEQELDVRPLRKPDKHPAIFQTYDALAVGESFVLVNNHDPKHLHDEFDTDHPGSYAWEYLDKGPDTWRIRISKLATTPLPRVLCDTAVIRDNRPDATGAVWKLQMRRRDLDSNIIRLQPGTSIGAHVGPDLDVLLLVLDGTGQITTELDTIDLHPGALVWLPQRSRRQFTAGPRGLDYLTVHQRRQSLVLNAAPPRGGRRPSLADRDDAEVQGHRLLARLGKRVLRPGGTELTTKLLSRADITDAAVIELAPGLGRTAREIIDRHPRSYLGIDSDGAAAAAVSGIVAEHGTATVADAAATGLPDESADVVIGEAMLSMQGTKAKNAIVAEAARVLRPGGRYAIHELGLTPDTLPDQVKTDIRQALARAIKVNSRPQTIAEWQSLLETHGLTVEHVDTAPMALLQPRRLISDEGLVGALRFAKNLLTHPDARRRVLVMRRIFRTHRTSLIAVAIIARKPVPSGTSFS